MKNFKYNVNGHQICIKLDEQNGTIAALHIDDVVPMPTAEEMPKYAAVVSLALLQYEVEEVHDEETGMLTISDGKSLWGTPVQQINTMSNMCSEGIESDIPQSDML